MERDSNEEITKMLDQLEAFFEPITQQLEPIINPVIRNINEEDEDPASATPAGAAKGKAADPKKDDKKKDAKAPPAKGAKGDATNA